MAPQPSPPCSALMGCSPQLCQQLWRSQPQQCDPWEVASSNFHGLPVSPAGLGWLLPLSEQLKRHLAFHRVGLHGEEGRAATSTEEVGQGNAGTCRPRRCPEPVRQPQKRALTREISKQGRVWGLSRWWQVSYWRRQGGSRCHFWQEGTCSIRLSHCPSTPTLPVSPQAPVSRRAGHRCLPFSLWKNHLSSFTWAPCRPRLPFAPPVVPLWAWFRAGFPAEYSCGCRRAGGDKVSMCPLLPSNWLLGFPAACMRSQPVPQLQGAAWRSLCQHLAASVPGSQLSADVPARESFPAQRERAQAQQNCALTFTAVQKGLDAVDLRASHITEASFTISLPIPSHSINEGKIFPWQGCSEH